MVRRLKPNMISLELGINDLTNLSPEVVGSGNRGTRFFAFGDIFCPCCMRLSRCSTWHFFRRMRPIPSAHPVAETVSFGCLSLPRVFCWTHYSFSNPSKPFYLADGVHLNAVGQYLLYRSYRGAILKALAML